jgi:glycosyltransferase involved in cell wall biosynthesis
MTEIYLSVIIPVYNEEKRLPKTLKEINDYLRKQKFESEIIVVSDGSTDRTCEVVEGLKSQIPNLKLICEKINKGKGYGVKIGMLNAKGKYRLFTDADNSTPISEIEKFWPEFEKGADVVIASRDIKGAILDPPQTLFRRFVGEVFKYLRKIIVGLWEIEDTQCGFKCFKEEVAEKIFPKCKIERFAFDPEVLLIAKKMGFKIKEVPVYWKNDLQSKVKFKSMVKMLIDLFKIRINLLKGKYG